MSHLKILNTIWGDERRKINSFYLIWRPLTGREVFLNFEMRQQTVEYDEEISVEKILRNFEGPHLLPKSCLKVAQMLTKYSHKPTQVQIISNPQFVTSISFVDIC